MDNRLISQVKRSLKIMSSYGISLVLLLVFTMPVLIVAKEDTPYAMIYLSFILFILFFFSVYVEMRETAMKEKRPQYNINPSPFKGLLYGLMGILPFVIIQIIVILIHVPENFIALKRRIYQGINGPLYWLSRILGNLPIHYVLSFITIIIIAGLGYFAGHKNFYLLAEIRKKFGKEKK